MESRLRAIEASLEAARTAVRRGGPFDRWDLEVRTGPFAAVRLLGTTEEHGAGRQQVRYRLWPRLARTAPMLALVFTGLAFAAARENAVLPAAILALVAVLVLSRMILDAGTASGALLKAIER